MRRPTLLLLASLLAVVTPAAAKVCETDLVPAATLLLPYFEASVTTPPTALETIIIVQNAVATPVAANVVLWSDYGIPVAAIPIALPGYDTISISLRDIVLHGRLPESDLSRIPASRFPSCANLLTQTDIAPTLLSMIQKALTGQPVPAANNRCFGSSSPGVARGYVTVDVVHDCTVLLPDAPAYFLKGGTGVAANDNHLWGASYFIDPAGPVSHAEPMVAIEADGNDAAVSTKGNYTFYARLVSWDARDNREPLATDFGVRFNLDAGVLFTTDLVIWRDTRFKPAPFTCGAPPSILIPNLPKHMSVFDEDGDSWPLEGPRAKLVTQRLPVVHTGSGPGFDIPVAAGNFGWIFLNLNHARPVAGATINPKFRRAAQGWVYGMVTSQPYIGSYEAVRFDNACRPDIAMRKP